MKINLRAILFTFAALALMLPPGFQASAEPARAAAGQPNISINGYYSMNKAPRGRTIQAAIVMDIPGGYHVNSNKPLGKYAIPTTIKIEAPGGVRTGAVRYPRAVVRGFKFSNEKLAVYEGRAVMRFSVTVPANYSGGKLELRARVRYQSCSDEVCYPPATREVSMWIDVAGGGESVRPANGNIFGRGR